MDPKTRKENLLLLLLGLVVGIVAVEIVGRLVYVKPWYTRLVEEQTSADWRRSLRLNSRGLRDQDYPAIKPAESRRVLILGDSFTFGDGVAADSAIFPQLLETSLATEYRTRGQKVEILNGGISGSLTSDWLNLLEPVQDEFQPDVILIVFFLRDGTRTTSMGSFFEPIREQITRRSSSSALYRASYVYRLIRDQLDKKEIGERYAAALIDSYFGSPEHQAEWQLAQKNLVRIRDIGRGRGAKVGLAVFPILVELDEDYPFKKICDELLAFGDRHGIPTLDLLPAFLGQDGPDLWVSAYNQHPNEKAHRIAAEALLPFLAKLLEKG